MISDKKGVAFLFSLFVMLIFIGISAVFILRTVHDSNMTKQDRNQVQSYYVAEGGQAAALDQINTLINTDMQNTINGINPSVVVSTAQSYVTSHDAIGYLIANVKDGNNVAQLTLSGTEARYSSPNPVTFGQGTYNYTIHFTKKSDPVAVSTDKWDFAYQFMAETRAIIAGVNRRLALSGDFTVRVQRDNFARYSLYTNSQSMPDNTPVYFNAGTNFYGPVHTNDRFNFAYNPSFSDQVTQTQSSARYNNKGSPLLIEDDHNSNIDVPVFAQGLDRSAPSVSLSSPVAEQSVIDQARGGQTYSTNGIYVPASGSTLNGGIYVKGDSSVALSVDASNNAVYTITQGSATKTITVNRSTNQTTVVSGGSSTTYSGKPEGVDRIGTLIYVDGNITDLRGTIQQDTQLTVSSHNDTTINGNITYASYTPGSGTPGTTGYTPPEVDNATNLLGIVSWTGNVHIGSSAPSNMQIHGTLLAKNGIVTVDNYDDQTRGDRGIITVLGGVIQNNYGAFGQFNSASGTRVSGYGRNFVYDQRMKTGSAPPYFPTLNTFVAFTNDIADKLVVQEGGS
ncbi:MAG: DUF4900 domain-containing protein [Candidatus Omnitrophica bacterium]|nr:DUF4900 domain-containing protein [Candidatus Omnitrophota bacterium]